MKKSGKIYFYLVLTLIASSGRLIANPLDLERRATVSAHDYQSEMVTRLEAEDWRRLSFTCRNLIRDFPDSPFTLDAHYYLGLAFFSLGDYELANNNFSNYLKTDLSPKFFDEVIQYKFAIAQAFESGSKRHLFGREHMPRWLPAYDEAIEIYDEVIAAVPRSDLAAQSLHRKGWLLLELKEYQKSVVAFQTLIRRFPKHPLAPESYLGIHSVYLAQCKNEFSDASRLDLSRLNLEKFKLHFPTEPRLETAKKMVLDLEETLAKELFEIGGFYRRTKKSRAAAMYYITILKRYPETKTAKKAKKRLDRLDYPPLEMPSDLEQELDRDTLVVVG
ncbi:MAG: tetratricopeptide repeat protein [Chlamydiota bacterium]